MDREATRAIAGGDRVGEWLRFRIAGHERADDRSHCRVLRDGEGCVEYCRWRVDDRGDLGCVQSGVVDAEVIQATRVFGRSVADSYRCDGCECLGHAGGAMPQVAVQIDLHFSGGRIFGKGPMGPFSFIIGSAGSFGNAIIGCRSTVSGVKVDTAIAPREMEIDNSVASGIGGVECASLLGQRSGIAECPEGNGELIGDACASGSGGGGVVSGAIERERIAFLAGAPSAGNNGRMIGAPAPIAGKRAGGFIHPPPCDEVGVGRAGNRGCDQWIGSSGSFENVPIAVAISVG